MLAAAGDDRAIADIRGGDGILQAGLGAVRARRSRIRGEREARSSSGETYIKHFPAEYHAQSAIWAALSEEARSGAPTRDASVEVETHEAGYTILGKDKEKWVPSTKETADHSLPYMVGMALLEGKVDNSTYSARN